MSRSLLLAALSLSLSTVVFADDEAKTSLAQVRENPNDVTTLRNYLNAELRAVAVSMVSDPDAALQRIDELEKVAAELKPETPAAKSVVSSLKSVVKTYRNRIRIQKSPYAPLAEQTSAIARIYRSNPDEAAAKLDALKEALAKAKESSDGKEFGDVLESLGTNVAAVERSITAGKRQVELIGQDAAPLKIETWVNGPPVTDADLKGKVVFLDFWAVWCGPCIATFPHLKEWNEKYADKGLVMIGVTKYYNYKWDEDAKKAIRIDEDDEKISPAAEQAMLVKFAESYGLKHRFGIQPDSTLADYYGVTGIPHVVVIDQQGKIRLMKVGSGEENAQAIGEMLDKLLGSASTGGE